MVSKALFSRDKNDWQTPVDLFAKLASVIPLSLDCASREDNSMLPAFRSPTSPVEWSAVGQTGLWLNPPYSPTKLCRHLVDDTYLHAREANIPAVILLPARPDTQLWQDVIFPKASFVVFMRSRLTFVGAPDPAPFPTALVFFNVANPEMIRNIAKLDLGTIVTARVVK